MFDNNTLDIKDDKDEESQVRSIRKSIDPKFKHKRLKRKMANKSKKINRKK